VWTSSLWRRTFQIGSLSTASFLSSSFAYRTDIEVSNQRRDEDPYSFPPCQALFQTANSRSSSLTNHQTEDYLEMGHFHDEGAPS